MIYDERGNLVNMIGFDYETYLIHDTLATPRGVCGSFASLEPFPRAMQLIVDDCVREGTGIYQERKYGQQPVYVALVPASEAARIVVDRLLELLEGEPGVMVAHNAAFDLMVTLNRWRLMEVTGTAPPLPTASPGWTREQEAHRIIMDALDLDGTGLPDSPGVIHDTMVREMLIKNAAGEMLHGVSLADLVKKRLGEDRSEDKKGTPCAKCSATGKVTTADPSKRSGVRQDVCPRCAGAKYDTPWRLRYAELEATPIPKWPRKAQDYAIEDAIDAVLVAIAQAGIPGQVECAVGGAVVVDEQGTVTDEHHQMRAAWSLELCRVNGPRSNPETIEIYEREMEALAAEGEALGHRLGFVRENGSKDTKVLQSLVEAAFRRQGLVAPRTSPSGRFPDGQIKTDEDAIELCGDPELLEYVATGEGRLALSKFVPAAKRGVEGALNSRPNVLVATGRESWANPAMHQPPRKGMFRECWVARPGRVYVSSDWKAAEMVTLAQIAYWLFGYSQMRDAINEGLDLHIYLGVELWNSQHLDDQLNYEGLAARIAQGDKAAKEIRQFSKIANFGFPGGLSARTFVNYARGYGVIITEAKSYEIREAWLRAWPEMVEYLQFFRDQAEFGDFTYVQWVGGRVRGSVGYTNGCNSGFQGLVSDALKISGWWAAREMYLPVSDEDVLIEVNFPHTPGAADTPRPVEIRRPLPQAVLPEHAGPLYGSRSWLRIHDEHLLESPEERAAGAAARIGRLMVMALAYCTPDVRTDADPCLMRAWRKDAEAVYGTDGVLIPWEDR